MYTSLLWHRAVLNIEMWVLKCLYHFIGSVAQILRGGRLLLLFNAVISDSAEFLSCVESAFCFVLWNKLECWWCGSTGKHPLSPRVCKCDLLLELLHCFGRLFFWNDRHSIKLLDLCRNNNRKNSETAGFLYQVWNACQWELPVSSTATPANLLADWPLSAPCSKEETTKNLKTKLWSQPEQQHTSNFSWSWVVAVLGCAALPAACAVSPRAALVQGVGGRSCCVKGWELLGVVLPSEPAALESSPPYNSRTSSIPALSIPQLPLPTPFIQMCWAVAWAVHLFMGQWKDLGFTSKIKKKNQNQPLFSFYHFTPPHAPRDWRREWVTQRWAGAS